MKRFFIALIIGVIYTTNAVGIEKTFSFTTLEYPPFISNELIKQNKSWVLDVVKAALEPQGYSIKVKIKPWARGFGETKEGKYDGIYAAGWTKET